MVNQPEVKVDDIDERITEIKAELNGLRSMRPGRLSVQYQDPKGTRRPYWQISYTRKGRSRTDYVKDQLVDELQKEIDEYERFKTLMDEWTSLALERSIALMKEKSKALPRRPYSRSKKKGDKA